MGEFTNKILDEVYKYYSSFKLDEGLDELGGWHSSPNDFDQFDNEKIGSGYGNAFGWGIYISTDEEVRQGYWDSVDKSKSLSTSWASNTNMIKDKILVNRGVEYTVEIPDDNGHNYNHWEKYYNGDFTQLKERIIEKYKEENEYVTDTDINLIFNGLFNRIENMLFKDIYNNLYDYFDSKETSLLFKSLGFVGHTYPGYYNANGHQDKGYNPNYVIYDSSYVKILGKKTDKNQGKEITKIKKAQFNKYGYAIISKLSGYNEDHSKCMVIHNDGGKYSEVFSTLDMKGINFNFDGKEYNIEPYFFKWIGSDNQYIIIMSKTYNLLFDTKTEKLVSDKDGNIYADDNLSGMRIDDYGYITLTKISSLMNKFDNPNKIRGFKYRYLYRIDNGIIYNVLDTYLNQKDIQAVKFSCCTRGYNSRYSVIGTLDADYYYYIFDKKTNRMIMNENGGYFTIARNMPCLNELGYLYYSHPADERMILARIINNCVKILLDDTSIEGIDTPVNSDAYDNDNFILIDYNNENLLFDCRRCKFYKNDDGSMFVVKRNYNYYANRNHFFAINERLYWCEKQYPIDIAEMIKKSERLENCDVKEVIPESDVEYEGYDIIYTSGDAFRYNIDTMKYYRIK